MLKCIYLSFMIPFYDIKRVIAPYREQLKQVAAEVIEGGQYIRGERVNAFEASFAQQQGVPYCLGVGNGYDALKLVLKSWINLGKLKKGDKVAIPSNTFIATALAVREVGLELVLVAADPETHLIDLQSLEKELKRGVQAVIVVHLFGQLVDMKKLQLLAEKYEVEVLEDAAQAHGATFDGQQAGTFGFPAAFSFYPAKNLGALGDAGAIVSDDEMLMQHVRKLANYGSGQKYQHELEGVNSRMDELQAAFLSVRLPFLEREVKERRAIAAYYLEHINHPKVQLPKIENHGHAWHLFVIRTERRDDLMKYMKENGVECLIHYPVDLRNNALFGENKVVDTVADQILSLPLFPKMEAWEMHKVVALLNAYQ